MSQNPPRPSEDEWLRADQRDAPLTALFQQGRRLVLGALALALLLVVIMVGRPATPPAKPAPAGAPELPLPDMALVKRSLGASPSPGCAAEADRRRGRVGSRHARGAALRRTGI